MSDRIKFVSDELGLLFNPNKETSRIKKSVNLIKDEHLARARELEKQKDLKIELAKTKDLQEINKQLREELKSFQAKREDYAKLEALNKELKEQIKARALSIEDLNKKIEDYQNELQIKNDNTLKKDLEDIDNNLPIIDEKSILKQFTQDFIKETEVKPERKFNLKNTFKIVFKEELAIEPKKAEDLPFFNKLVLPLKKLIDIIKKQSQRILNLENKNKELECENRRLNKEILKLSSLNHTDIQIYKDEVKRNFALSEQNIIKTDYIPLKERNKENFEKVRKESKTHIKDNSIQR